MKVISFILAGGSGKELGVLTRHRAKTAIPFGGRYRVIDFCLSNCANSGIKDIFVLAQYNPKSLINHIGMGKPWDLDRKTGGVYILQPSYNGEIAQWYKGTGDALLQNSDLINDSDADYVLILSGDQVYTMNYQNIIDHHIESSKPVTIVFKEIARSMNQYLGMLSVDNSGVINDFVEKPCSSNYKHAFMGIYLFNREYLIKLLYNKPRDLVFDLLMPEIEDGMVGGYEFKSFWQDIGSLSVYYRTSMNLLEDRCFLLDKDLPMFTRSKELAPTRFLSDSSVTNSILASGCTIGGNVVNSIIFPGVDISEGASIEDSIILPFSKISKNAVIKKAVIDKMVKVEEGVIIGVDTGGSAGGYITTVGKGSKIKKNSKIGKGSMIEPVSIVSGDLV
ncbi:MAG TPA: glucose-1-phosphate adenylyltransferase subunit GlgD [Candidatus Krumholzibacteriaceae bacterium]|nr:glucose-1-phosphate adenylyltransferase subunit GlgD [Candidatus Krumholzibacteriaceae bacterium]